MTTTCRLTLILAALLLNACASAPKAPESASANPPSASSVDICYVLGHNQHRIHAESGNDGVRAQAFVDKQLIEQNAIDRGHYDGFLTKATSFVEQTSKSPAPASEHAACRTPFTVTVKIGEDTKVSHGCRSASVGEEAAISHLVRDGEFLLSSTKQN